MKNIIIRLFNSVLNNTEIYLDKWAACNDMLDEELTFSQNRWKEHGLQGVQSIKKTRCKTNAFFIRNETQNTYINIPKW